MRSPRTTRAFRATEVPAEVSVITRKRRDRYVVGRLPPEIMALIFREVASMEPVSFTFRIIPPEVHPILLVCWYWYHVALDTPTLWRRINTIKQSHAQEYIRNMPKAASRLKYRLQLTKGCSILDFHLRVEFGNADNFEIWMLLFNRIQDWSRVILRPVHEFDLKSMVGCLFENRTKARNLAHLRILDIEELQQTARKMVEYLPVEIDGADTDESDSGIEESDIESFDTEASDTEASDMEAYSREDDDLPSQALDWGEVGLAPSTPPTPFPRLRCLELRGAAKGLLSVVGYELEELTLVNTGRTKIDSLSDIPNGAVFQIKFLHLRTWDGVSPRGSGREFPELKGCWWDDSEGFDLRLFKGSTKLSKLALTSRHFKILHPVSLPSVVQLYLQLSEPIYQLKNLSLGFPNVKILILEPELHLRDHGWEELCETMQLLLKKVNNHTGGSFIFPLLEELVISCPFSTFPKLETERILEHRPKLSINTKERSYFEKFRHSGLNSI